MTTQLPHTFRPSGGCMDCGAPANTKTETCDEYRTLEWDINQEFNDGVRRQAIQPTTKGGEPCPTTAVSAESNDTSSGSNPAAVESNPPGDAGKRAICNACGEYTEDCRCGTIHAPPPTPATDTPVDAALNALCKACGFPIVDDRIQLLETVGKMVKRQSNELTASLATVAQLREALDAIGHLCGMNGTTLGMVELAASKALTTPAPAVVPVAKVLPIDADYLEEQIAFELDAAGTNGRLSVNKLVTENRSVLRQLIDSSIKRALTPATKG